MTSRSQKSRLTFLIYDKEKTPYYVNVKSSLLKLLLTLLPLTSLLCLIALVMVAFNFKRIIVSAERAQPVEIQGLKNQIVTLENQLTTEKEEMLLLQTRLNQKSVSNYPDLDIFQIPQGMTDKRSEKILEVGQFISQIVNSNLQISFNINNLSKDKLAGHIYVLYFKNNSIQIFPPIALENESLLLKYNQGESFFTARFRPSQVSFNSSENKGLAKIVIFSRMGDLLFSKKYILGN